MRFDVPDPEVNHRVEELASMAEEALESTPERYPRDGDQSSGGMEVGTAFARSASDAPSGESSDGVKVSFEEQMVLAMALSIADVQTRVHQGDNRSGPLLQPAPPLGDYMGLFLLPNLYRINPGYRIFLFFYDTNERSFHCRYEKQVQAP